MKLLTMRVDKISETMEQSIACFTRDSKQHFCQDPTIQVDMMDNANRAMYQQRASSAVLAKVISDFSQVIDTILSKWNGVRETDRIKANHGSFRIYFSGMVCRLQL